MIRKQAHAAQAKSHKILYTSCLFIISLQGSSKTDERQRKLRCLQISWKERFASCTNGRPAGSNHPLSKPSKPCDPPPPSLWVSLMNDPLSHLQQNSQMLQFLA